MKLETPRLDADYKPKTDILKRIDTAAKKKETLLQEPIGPDEARDILSRNLRNRPLYETRVDKWARLMIDEKWRPIGIIFMDRDGILMDAQHRLHAIVKSGTTQIFDIKTGQDPEDMRVLDTGKSRTPGDYLGMKGYVNAGLIASAVRFVTYFKRESRVSGKIHDDVANTMDVDEFMSDPVREKRMLDAVQTTIEKYKKINFLRPTQWAALHYLTYEANAQKGQTFMHLLATGDGVSSRKFQAMYLLRNELLQFTPNAKSGGVRLNAQDIVTKKWKYIIKAWNAFVSEKGINDLTLSRQELALPTIERMVDMKKAI